MKHAIRLFDARTMFNDTTLMRRLKLLLGNVCAYGGEIPMSIPQLAKRLKTSTTRIRITLVKLQNDGVIHYENGKLFFDCFEDIKDSPKNSNEKTNTPLYGKFFKFFESDDFIREQQNVQRFVLHFVGYHLVYRSGSFKSLYLTDLFGAGGLLNVRTKKEALNIVEKASKYLHIHLYANSIRVTGLKQEWAEMGEYHSEGAILWIQRELREHGFCCEQISDIAIQQIAKVMEFYYDRLGYTTATQLFQIALTKLQAEEPYSYRFFEMLYKTNSFDNEISITDDEKNQISAYFRGIMKECECIFAGKLDDEFDKTAIEVMKIKEQAKKAAPFINKNDQVEQMEFLKTQQNTICQKLKSIQALWLHRFKADSEWFLQRGAAILKLNPKIMDGIQREIWDTMQRTGTNW